MVTVNDKGYTKHYFEEGKRICSKIGSGGFQDLDILVDQMELNYDEQFEVQREGLHNTFNECFGVSSEINTNDMFVVIKQCDNPGEPVFYYHSDHLGSASYITDDQGNETQHLVYLPFGELRSNREYLNINNKYHEQHWVDMKYNTSQYDTPYKFNGKEKDPETGYNYYGARFYYDYLSIFLSTDPMSDKYPSLSSYAYCANNPVMLIDPDGREWLTSEDAATAKNMQKGIGARNKELDKMEAKANGTIDKYKNRTDLSKREQRKLNDANAQSADIKSQREYLSNLDKGIDQLGNSNNKYTFSGGQTDPMLGSMKDGTIVINNDGTGGNIAHEITHAIQYDNNVFGFIFLGGKDINVSRATLENMEIEAYKTQFSYSGKAPSSYYGSSLGTPFSLQGINTKYLQGLRNSNGQFQYRH